MGTTQRSEMKAIINILLVVITLAAVGVAGFGLGIKYVHSFKLEDYKVIRTCNFYQEQYDRSMAIAVCEDGTWWSAYPYIFIPATDL